MQLAVAPNSANGYEAGLGASCAIVTVQNIEKMMGYPVDTADTIIKNFGLPASQFEDGGIGLVDTTGARGTTTLLNAALNPDGLAVSHTQVNSEAEFETLIGNGGVFALGTYVNGPLLSGPVGGTLHLVAAGSNEPDSDTLTIYNPTGSGGTETYSPAQAWANNYPYNGTGNSNGASGMVWRVYQTGD
jgi:hypothetical protein